MSQQQETTLTFLFCAKLLGRSLPQNAEAIKSNTRVTFRKLPLLTEGIPFLRHGESSLPTAKLIMKTVCLFLVLCQVLLIAADEDTKTIAAAPLDSASGAGAAPSASGGAGGMDMSLGSMDASSSSAGTSAGATTGASAGCAKEDPCSTGQSVKYVAGLLGSDLGIGGSSGSLTPALSPNDALKPLSSWINQYSGKVGGSNLYAAAQGSVCLPFQVRVAMSAPVLTRWSFVQPPLSPSFSD